MMGSVMDWLFMRQSTVFFRLKFRTLSARWNHCTSTPHRSETNGIAEGAVRRVKEGTSAVLLQSGQDEEWWADSMEMSLLSAKHS